MEAAIDNIKEKYSAIEELKRSDGGDNPIIQDQGHRMYRELLNLITKAKISFPAIMGKPIKDDDTIEDLREEAMSQTQEFGPYGEVSTKTIEDYRRLEAIDKKVDLLEEELTSRVNDTVEHYNKILKESNVEDVAKVNSEFKALQKSHSTQYKYVKTFYSNLNEYLMAYSVLHSSIVKGDPLTAKDTVAKVVIGKATEYSVKITKGIPVVGSVVGALDEIADDIYTGIKSFGLKKKVNIMHKIMSDKLLLINDVPIAAAKTALCFNEKRKKELEKLAIPEVGAEAPENKSEEEEVTVSKGRWQKFRGTMTKLREKAKEVKDVYKGKSPDTTPLDSAIEDVAIADIAKLLSYMYTEYKSIIEDDTELYGQFGQIELEKVSDILGEGFVVED